ncbi:MAG TPA: Ig-like domain repeat protein, partial [Thermoanaerobaculia bacterium]|nr:Ig-like domain repeat protein [Thermoanaerobaculia bacterium]
KTAIVTCLPNTNDDIEPGQHEGKGYVFEQPGGGWAGSLTEDAQLVGSDVGKASLFGWAVSMSGNVAVMGDSIAQDRGEAYIFNRPVGGWTGTRQEDDSLDGTGDAAFGLTVAISGNTIIVGAPAETIDGNFAQGAAHVYDFVRPYVSRTRFLVQGPIRVAPGVPVEFRYVVDGLGDSPIAPTGEVVVSDGAGQTCRGDVSTAGGGSCTLTFGAPGTFHVRAEYLGNLSFGGSTSPPANVFVR